MNFKLLNDNKYIFDNHYIEELYIGIYGHF